MFKIKKRTPTGKGPVLYNIIEDYTESDPPGNVTVCAMTEPEDLETHATVLAESYDIPLEEMRRLLKQGGLYLYSESGELLTHGAFVCRIETSSSAPKQTWRLDMVQYAEAEQLANGYGLPRDEAAWRVFLRSLAPDLQKRLREKNLGLDYAKLDRAVARGGDIKYIDYRKDWSPHFKRLCIMPDGRLVETGGLEEFARLQGISVPQARTLIEHGGTFEVGEELLACQIVNGQPTIARFSRMQYAKAKELVQNKGLHLMDALSEVGLSDPVMMRALRRLEQRMGRDWWPATP
jgi:hypothetical protein